MIRKLFVGFWAFLWNSLNFIRRFILNAILLAILIAIGTGVWTSFQPQVPKNAVLTVAPYGALVEQWQGDPVEAAIGQALGESNPQTRLYDLLRAIRSAATDENIAGLALYTDDLFGAGPAQLQDLAAAIAEFRDNGKPVFAYGSRFTQAQYYLAAQANQVHMDPMGEVLLQGFSSWRNYYASAAEKLKATVNVFRVGEYKSAVEPWLRDDMSPAAREANQAWLNSLWASWSDNLATRRQIPPVRLESYVQDFHVLLAASEGDSALTASATGLVDRLATPQQFVEFMVEQFGQDDSVDYPDFVQVDTFSYLADLDIQAFQQEAIEPKPKVAVVVAEGALMEGAAGSGYANIGLIEDQLWSAAHDDSVAAVVLRVSSPGGTVTASETLRRAVDYVKSQGKPVVISMGTVAASGGYWMSASADRIFAQPDTLTGSIGIYGIVPTFEKSLAEIGVYTDGVATSPFAGSFRVDRELSGPVKKSIQLYIEQGYQRFLNTVSTGRNMAIEDVVNAASGRVWIGSKALEFGLVDELGGLYDAVTTAAELAKVSDYELQMLEPELGFLDQMLVGLSGGIQLPAAWSQSQLITRWLADAPELGLLKSLVNQSEQREYELTLGDIGFAWTPLTLQ